MGAAKVSDKKLHIDENVCIHCGRCVGNCRFDSIKDGAYGFKIFIGGRWGKKVSHGRALSKVFVSKDEAMDVIEKAILLFRERGIAGERFAVMLERIGFEEVERLLLGMIRCWRGRKKSWRGNFSCFTGEAIVAARVFTFTDETEPLPGRNRQPLATQR